MITALPRPVHRSELLEAPSSGRRSCRILIGPLRADGPALAYRLDDFNDKTWITPLSYDHDLEDNPQAVLEDFNRGLDEAAREGFLTVKGSRPDHLEQPPNSSVARGSQIRIETLVGKH